MRNFIKRVNRYLKRKYRSFRGRNIRALVGMTTIEEREYWKNYSAQKFTGRGAIIDLGCWFGSTTFSLGEGLDLNKRIGVVQKKIYAYDLFSWEEWMNPFVKNTPYENKFRVGDDFSDAFRFFTKKHKKKIECRKVDLTAEKWTGGDIEFLLIDAMKSWELCQSIYKNFYPSLKAGLSEILHQDYAHYYTYWIHLLQFRLKEYFTPIKESSNGGSLGFAYIKQIPEELLSMRISKSQFSKFEIDKAFEYSLSAVKTDSIPPILAAKVMAYHDILSKEDAETLLIEIAKMGYKHHDIDAVKNEIKLACE